MKRILKLLSLCLLWLLPAAASGQTGQDGKPDDTAGGWYVGLQGGMPFGFSTFSSFGADRTHAGWSAGVHGGYRFNPVLSLEAVARWGGLNLSARDCCFAGNYWLGADGLRYEAPVLDGAGWHYSDLKSRVSMQSYGLQLNVNVLGFFHATKASRWTLEIAPALAAVGTKASVRTLSDNTEAMRGDSRWHLGVGGNVQAAYRIGRHLNVGIYSGLTYLTGDRMDGMPEHLHKNNFVWESGIRLGWTFGRKGKAKPSSAVPVSVPAATGVPEKEYTDTTASAPDSLQHAAKEMLPETKETLPDDKGESVVTVESAVPEQTETVQLDFPAIYFAFDSYSIAETETGNLNRILALLSEHPDVKVTLSGWGDTYGSKEANDRISLRRAETVKKWLVEHGVAASRIETAGMGSDPNADTPKKARRVDTNEQKRKEDNR